MRIALLHPTYWPEVRRGSERLIHDLGCALGRRGHSVDLITSAPGPTAVRIEEGVRVLRLRRPPLLPGLHFYEDHVANIPHLVLRLARGNYDLAHAFFPADAWAALQARRWGGPPYVFSIHGIVSRKHLVRRRYRLEMFAQAIAGSAVTSVLSEAAARPVRRYLLHQPAVLPGGVDLDAFVRSAPSDDSPSLLSPASLEDPRKRGSLLLRAFGALHRERPETRLLVAGGQDPFANPQLAGAANPVTIELPSGAKAVDATDPAALPALYSRAWVTVLPSVDEAFGLVLLESLAAGTPVVAARSGACPDIVDSLEVGRLFEPDDEDDLARALGEALELASQPGTAAACRRRASLFGWPRVVELYEATYDRALTGASSA